MSLTNPQAFNASKGVLKLGSAPMSEELRVETERVLREQAMMDRDFTGHEISLARPLPTQGIMLPTESDLLPRPLTFKTIDVEREVNIVRDARKRIRLEPSVLANIDPSSPQANALRARALPSICAYTLHDVAEGSVMISRCLHLLNATIFRSPCCSFSPDTSLMAAGFAESYIRLWSLKGEKLRGIRSDFSLSTVKDGKFCFNFD